MVHTATNRQGHVATGVFGIPSLNDCSGTITRPQYEEIVRRDAIEAQHAEARRQEEKRQRQQETARLLQEQINAKKNRLEMEKRQDWAEETRLLQDNRAAMESQQAGEHALRTTYRDYLKHCHEFSKVSQGLLTLDTQDKQVKQEPLHHGTNLMPFVGPAQEQRQMLEQSSKTEQMSRRKKDEERERSTSPRDVIQDKWKFERDMLTHEVEELERQAARRAQVQHKRQNTIEYRAARAIAVQPPRQATPRASPRTSSNLFSASPRQATAPLCLSRREVQGKLRVALEEQLEEKRRTHEESARREREEGQKAMRCVADMIVSSRKRESEEKEIRQLAYRRDLEKQAAAHPDTRAGFLPEVAVKPFRRAADASPASSRCDHALAV